MTEKMSVECEGEGKGATFVLSFPLEKSPGNDREYMSSGIVHVVERDLTTEMMSINKDEEKGLVIFTNHV